MLLQRIAASSFSRRIHVLNNFMWSLERLIHSVTHHELRPSNSSVTTQHCVYTCMCVKQRTVHVKWLHKRSYDMYFLKQRTFPAKTLPPIGQQGP